MTGALLIAGWTAAQALAPLCGPALDARFFEDAPRDRMVLETVAGDGWQLASTTILLEGSAGRLIFDTEAGGPGSSVYQPFRPSGGAARLAEAPRLADGDRTLALAFARFGPGERFVFTLDLDDMASSDGSAGTMIAGAEIAGATLLATFVTPEGGTETYEGAFGADARARATPPCVS